MKKNAAFRMLMIFVLLTVLFAACVPAAVAETGKQFAVTIDIDLSNNMFMARYGVTVFMDNTKLGKLVQGARLIKIQILTPGIHTVRILPDKAGVTEMSFDIYVSSSMTLVSTLQTHRKYVNVNAMSVTLPDKVFTFRDTDDCWSSFIQAMLQEMIRDTIVNYI